MQAGGRAALVAIDKPDARIHDAVALDEIELYGNLMIAASESDGRLSQERIDEVLGIRPAPAVGSPRS